MMMSMAEKHMESSLLKGARQDLGGRLRSTAQGMIDEWRD